MRLAALFLFYALPVVLPAQSGRATPLLFRNLTERDGLPYRDARCLHFDERGALWIGTSQGLAVYDGGVLAAVPLEVGRPQPDVEAIARDSTGQLWLGTTHGLYKLDPRSRAREHWPLPWVTRRDGFIDAVPTLCATADGMIYCAGQGGFYRFDPLRERFDSLVVDGRRLLRGGHIVRADSGGTGFWAYSVERKLMYFNALEGRFHHSGSDQGANPLLQGIEEQQMVTDRHGNTWMTSNASRGIRRYSPGDRTIRSWAHLPGHPEITLLGWPSMHVDAHGLIWLMGEDFIPLRFDPADSSVVRVVNDPHDPGAIASNFINDVAIDREGRTWFATKGGVSVLSDGGFTYSLLRMGGLVQDRTDVNLTCMRPALDGGIWMGTELGLLHADLSTGRKDRVLLDAVDKESNAILDMCSSDEGLWLATRNGIWTYDERTRRARKFTAMPADAQHMRNITYAWMARGEQGAIWAGTWGRGLVRIDPGTGSCTYHAPDGADPRSLPEGILVCGTVTRNGDLWIGHGGKGLVRYDQRSGKFARVQLNGLSHDTIGTIVLSIREDASGRLWLGVRDIGLVRFEPATGHTQVFGFAHGLRGALIQSMQLDARGRVWVGTSNQLACFDPERERFIAMPVDAGGPFQDFESASLARASDDFLFSTVTTVVRFDPLVFDLPSPPRAPDLREVFVYNQRRSWLPGDELVFSHVDDQLDLRFGIASLPRAISAYSYVLEGATRDWVSSTSGSARFNNVAPGEYTLRMKVQDQWGNWSPEGRMRFVILPPWWQTLWARVLFALAVAGLIMVSFRLRLNWIRERERKEETMARTVNELKLQALRAQMDPHFIFNALNSVDRFILGEEKRKASHYLNRFARLIRLILQQSESTTVPLEREVEMLKYYLELETIRFEAPFTWEVKVDPLLTREAVELPTMLVQPFAENAIWHGLQHKQGPGHVEVAFRKVDHGVECTIEDNGVGRAASREINRDRSGVHKSTGMRVTTERIELLKEQHQRAARVSIHDLADEQGRPLGTRVVVLVPLENGTTGADA